MKCPSIGFAVKQLIDVHTLTFICPHVHAMAGRVYSAEKILQTYIDMNNVHVPLHGKLHNDNLLSATLNTYTKYAMYNYIDLT